MYHSSFVDRAQWCNRACLQFNLGTVQEAVRKCAIKLVDKKL